ncbi:hypothetical protein M127_1848 [Bacteroides fragilis str. S6L5]|nr:hypothetical protein M130_1858 [Bacteroides fragilis str. S6R6]EYE52366.1 hypothetical protein M127_1848 [Bacteroides fragilis str. S6L5]
MCFPFLFSPQFTPILYYPLFSETTRREKKRIHVNLCILQ